MRLIISADHLAGIAQGVFSPDISWSEFAQYKSLLQELLSLLVLFVTESDALNFLPDVVQSMKNFTGHKIMYVNYLRKLKNTFFPFFSFSFRSLFSMTGMFFFMKAPIPSELRKLKKCGPEI